MKRLFLICLAVLLMMGSLSLTAAAEEMKLPAKGAVLMDAATGTVLYEQNAHEKLHPASVTKVMTMLLVMEALDQGKITLTDAVTASESAAAKGGSQIYLKVGEQMTVETLLKSVAVASANDAACALAEHLAGSEAAFVQKMNQRAKELKMEDTHFVNCTGLDDGEDAKNHLTSAYDIALMSRQLLYYHPSVKNYTTIWMDTVRDGTFGLSNTNKLVRFYSGCTGLKTGYTSQAGFCLSASAMREDMELIAVVLGCSTSQERFSACKSMLDYGFANYAVIAPNVEAYPEVKITLGEKKQVKVTTTDRCSLLIDKGQKNEVRCTLEVMEKVTAPVSKGQRLGTMTVRCGEQILAQLPLVAEETVPRLSFGQIWKNLLRTLFLG